MSTFRAGPHPGQRSASFYTFAVRMLAHPDCNRTLRHHSAHQPLTWAANVGAADRSPTAGSAASGHQCGTRCSPTFAATGTSGEPGMPRRCTRVQPNNAPVLFSPLRGMLGVKSISCVKPGLFSPICPQFVHSFGHIGVCEPILLPNTGDESKSCCIAPRKVDLPRGGGYHLING